MRNKFLSLAVVLFAAVVSAQQPKSQAKPLDATVERIFQKENSLSQNLHEYTPLMETYLQILEVDPELGLVPKDDRYFLGKVNFKEKITEDVFQQKKKGKIRSAFDAFDLTGIVGTKIDRNGFLYTALVDETGFTAENYSVEYVRREFLGEIRCLVFNVAPVKNAKGPRFLGRVWVDEQEGAIVRFNGVRTPNSFKDKYIHFDSWRYQVAPGMWLPSLVYLEESNLKFTLAKGIRMKGQTRFWGYNVTRGTHSEELTQVVVDAPEAVKDNTQSPLDMSPINSTREWQHQAEDSVLEKMQRGGLLAPEGEVDKVLKTVVNNLQITNNMEGTSEIRCRVLLTSPLESLTIGNTIVVSRGLLDVLPDEATLAAVMAHELAHIALGHTLDTQYAFFDRTLFPDQDAFHRIIMRHTEAEETAADQKSIELLKNSPYAEKLTNIGLFLRTLNARSTQLPQLISPHMGNRMAASNRVLRMNEVMASAPELKMNQADQVTALPIGGRIKLDPWSDSVELMKSKPVAATTAREKMPFEVTPVYPYLTRVKVDAPVSAEALGNGEPSSKAELKVLQDSNGDNNNVQPQ